MARRRNFLSALVGTSLSTQAQAAQPSLHKELAARGYALSQVSGRTVSIRPFDNSPTIVRRFPLQPVATGATGETVACSWASDGQAVAFFRRRRNQQPSSLVVVDRKGLRLWSVDDAKISSGALSLSPDHTKVAVLMPHRDEIALWHLHSNADLVRVASARLLREQLWSFYQGWLPDGRGNILSWNDSIHLCEANGRCIEIIAGTDPSLSPDGKYLSYRTPDGRLNVTLLSAPDSKPLFRARRSAGPAAWSQDSRYIVFATSVSDASVFATFRFRYANDVIVGRISDGATLKVWDNGGRRIDNVGWIPHWQEFAQHLPEFQPAEPR